MGNLKILIVFLFVMLSINLAYAGKIHDLDFSKNNIITTIINERDVARFTLPYRNYDLEKYNEGDIDYNLVDKEHKVMIREIVNNKSFIRLTVFIEDAEIPQYLNLGFNNFINLDFDRDSLNDMTLRLNNIDEENKEVTLTFEGAREEDKKGKIQLFGRTKRTEKQEENFITRLLSKLLEIFKKETSETNEIIAEEEGEEKEEVVPETTISGKPRIIDTLADNWILTTTGLIIILILVWNKRQIKRGLRRMFWL